MRTIPEVGEVFTDGTDSLCMMLKDGMYISSSMETGIMYNENSLLFSKKRTEGEMKEFFKGKTMLKDNRMHQNYFNFTLNDGHDTKQGLKKIEAAYIEHVFKLARYNQSEAARLLDMSRGTLRTKLKEYFGDKYL